jgi:exoribonuclease-2
MDPLAGKKHVLWDIAERAMRGRGLETDFSPEARRQVEQARPAAPDTRLRDLTSALWCSIDNDDSRDLDQLTVAEPAGDSVRCLVAIADVDTLVPIDSPIDRHAQANTTSVYTGIRTFPMLPLEFSTGLTSLNEGEDRVAIVIDMRIDRDGHVADSSHYPARVRNRAKLAYSSVGAWLEGRAAIPEAVRAVAGMEAQLRLQDSVAQTLRRNRHSLGALELETIEPRPVLRGDEIVDLRRDIKNRANDLIEDLMIAANGATARKLNALGYPAIRRVVRLPERWDRIVEIARQHGAELPSQPDCRALSAFLTESRHRDPERFPDLSLTIVKLLGRGEYVLIRPGEASPGHFGLAVRDYTHSTAPNRRFPDLIAQRLVKAACAGRPSPYSDSQLAFFAGHCTQREDDADRVERQVRKSAAALLLSQRVGETFDAIVTGASPKGTWARLLSPPVEGKITRGGRGLDVGDRVRVQLVSCDVQRGFIDFTVETGTRR